MRRPLLPENVLAATPFPAVWLPTSIRPPFRRFLISRPCNANNSAPFALCSFLFLFSFAYPSCGGLTIFYPSPSNPYCDDIDDKEAPFQSSTNAVLNLILLSLVSPHSSIILPHRIATLLPQRAAASRRRGHARLLTIAGAESSPCCGLRLL